MFKRKILKELQEWKISSNRKPLVLRGARQVGKSTAVHMFADEFENYIYLNMEVAEDRNIFREEYTIRELFQAILVIKNVSLGEGDVLIFIDEIQNSPVAMKMLRYFYEELEEIYVIAAGSLLEMMLGEEDISFPVGRVEFRYMYPLTFREYLEAREETKIAGEYDTVPLSRISHSRLLSLFHEYVMIGGMPEVVKRYIEGREVTALKSIYESLMIAYINDSAKYAANTTMRHVIRHCLETIPYEAGKRITFQGFGKSNYRSREVGEALRIVERAMILFLIYPSTSVEIPIVGDRKKSPKLQYLDTGLLNYYAGLQPNYFKYDDLHSFYRGIIAEHVVMQELIAHDSRSNQAPHFWVREKRQSTAEVDVIMQQGSRVIPVEVKSGGTGTLKSLHQFMKKASHDFAVRLYAGEFAIIDSETTEGKKFRLMNVPYYLAGKIYDYIDFFIDKDTTYHK